MLWWGSDADLGPEMRVDHVDIGAGIDAGDINSSALPGGTNIGVISNTAGAGYRYLNGLNPQIQYNVDNSMTYADFRIYFQTSTDGDLTWEWMNLWMAEANPTEKPKLHVKYCNP